MLLNSYQIVSVIEASDHNSLVTMTTGDVFHIQATPERLFGLL